MFVNTVASQRSVPYSFFVILKQLYPVLLTANAR
jgi:hypothetical protein